MSPRARDIAWRVHLRSSPAEVYRMIATPEGRARFWADSADAPDGRVEFRFGDGTALSSRILSARPERELRLTYFEGTAVTFRLEEDGRGGTDLLLIEEGLSESGWRENLPGWVSVLLNLKAVLDHGVDLRNHDPARSWRAGYVDV